MRYPHERYILALMIDRLSLQEIKGQIKALGLALPAENDLVRIEAGMMDLASPDLRKYLCDPGKKLTKKRRRPLAELIVRLGLTPYKSPDYDFSKIKECRTRDEVRIPLETLLLSAVTLEEVAALLNDRFSLDMRVDDVRIYRDFFFDTREFDPASWFLHFHSIPPQEARVKVAALRFPEDVAHVKHEAGFAVRVKYSDLLQDVYTSSYYKWKEKMATPSADYNQLGILVAIMVKAGDRHEKYKSPDEKTVLEQMRIKIEAMDNEPEVGALEHIGPLPQLESGEAPRLLAIQGGRSDKSE